MKIDGVNNYFNGKLAQRLALLPERSEELIAQARQLSNMGINCEEDHQLFFNIWQQTQGVARELTGKSLNKLELAKLSSELFSAHRYSGIKSAYDFCKAVGLELQKNRITITKIAYPQGDGVAFIETPRDISKWMQTMRNIYTMSQQSGCDLNTAFNLVTENWDNMERKDLKHWMAFYEENAHQKYKTAQDKYYQAAPGVMIPIDHLKAKLPPDMSAFDGVVPNQEALQAQKREEAEKKIKALQSRLNAAERIATDPEVSPILHSRIEMGLPKWLEELQRVKRMIQLAPLRNARSSLLQDLILKRAAILKMQGYPKAAREMAKFAQESPPVEAVAPQAEQDEGDQALDELIEGMNFAGDLDDAQDVQDMDDDPLASITVIAQELPLPQPEQPVELDAVLPEETEGEASVEVQEEEEEFASTPMHSRTDSLFEAALQNVTLNDVIGRLESLANLFRTREIPRQLAIIDLMMDKLNLAAFFPNLAEASSKSLESNQYALTRVEEILSKLRGAVKTPKSKEIDLTGNNPPPAEALPEMVNPQAVRENLQSQEIAEKQRKEQRKQEQAAAEQATQQPITNVTEDLAQPVPAPVG